MINTAFCLFSQNLGHFCTSPNPATLQKSMPLRASVIEADKVFGAFFLFYIKNCGSRLSPPSFRNIPREWGWKNKSTWLNISLQNRSLQSGFSSEIVHNQNYSYIFIKNCFKPSPNSSTSFQYPWWYQCHFSFCIIYYFLIASFLLQIFPLLISIIFDFFNYQSFCRNITTSIFQ